jgi:hypothetical protein
VYFAFGSICGNTSVSDAAASTLGTDSPLLDDAVVAGLEFAFTERVAPFGGYDLGGWGTRIHAPER